MRDSIPPGHSPLSFRTRMSHAGRAGTRVRGFVNPPVMRGSTVLSTSIADRLHHAPQRMEQVMTYGTNGGPTHHALEDTIAEIEGGTRCQITSTGLSAVTTALQAFLGAGDHLLMTDSCYGPARDFCDKFLARFGVETTYYCPDIDGDGITKLIRPNTRVVYVESPGTHTFEVQDVPAIALAAHAHGGDIAVLMDNTWGLHFFQPFDHGVDVSIQALTKYAGGHSDVLLGGITVRERAMWEKVRTASMALGHFASPDDCWLTLRGIRTLSVRLEQQMRSGIEVATWLAGRPEVASVLHPALPGAPGHEIWRRDFSGACSLFGVMLQPSFTVADMHRLIDSLELFGIGASWGGYESLALPSTGFFTRVTGRPAADGPIIRLHVGLEDPADLIADLERGLSGLHQRR